MKMPEGSGPRFAHNGRQPSGQASMTQIEPGDSALELKAFCGLLSQASARWRPGRLRSAKQFHQTSHCNPWAKPEMIIHWWSLCYKQEVGKPKL